MTYRACSCCAGAIAVAHEFGPHRMTSCSVWPVSKRVNGSRVPDIVEAILGWAAVSADDADGIDEAVCGGMD